ncbi:MAG: hypothetical protein ACTSQ4_02355 [Candidatus Heimdallarchaeaceae archaeon]
MNKQEWISLGFMLGLYVAVGLFAVAIYTLVTNVEELQTDTITYSIKKNNFTTCSCFDSDGRTHRYNSSGPISNIIFTQSNYSKVVNVSWFEE